VWGKVVCDGDMVVCSQVREVHFCIVCGMIEVMGVG
jgi:hypothetical protein